MTSPTSTSSSRLAATLLLLRDGAQGLEVFMVQRHRRIDFASGALVFPGGKVDPEDQDPTLRTHCRGSQTFSAAELTLRVAGLRETFEECGVLLAYAPDETQFVSAERLSTLAERYCEELRHDRIAMLAVLEREKLELACDALIPFAHWITPQGMPKRFDTHFFLAAAPAHQLARHDGTESVDSLWISPQRALDEARAGKHTIIFPTQMNLRKLARSRSIAEALTRAESETIVTVMPRLEVRPEGRFLCIPEEAGYGISEARFDDFPR